jgi:formimidoylglutamate deiminase
MQTLHPDWTWIDGAFVEGVGILITPEGTLGGILPSDAIPPGAIRLPGRALMPGFINAHSHAFQRAIRGATHHRTQGSGDDFWSWRDAMYRVVEHIDRDGIRALSRLAFLEMLKSGYTGVGEFHYIHHDPAHPEDANALSKAVIEAAQEVGIRIRLLRVAYERSGFASAPPSPGQLRFIEPNSSAIIAHSEALGAWCRTLGDPRVAMGIAPHSVRAVGRETLVALGEWANANDHVLHVHASEQPAEVRECLDATGLRPVAWLDEIGVMSARATIVHATHLDDDDIARLAASGATVCACPTTEADLGDGILPAGPLHASGVPFALGSDSQAMIDPFQEMRLLEMHERLRTGARACLLDSNGSCAPVLLKAATQGGARSLAWEAGAIVEGALADLITVDLTDLRLAGATPETLPAMLACHGHGSLVRDVWTQGQHIVKDGVHRLDNETRREFEDTLHRIRSH